MKSRLAGINLGVAAQLRLLHDLGSTFGDECCFPQEAAGDETVFNLDNTNFSFGCAAALHAVIRYYRPRLVIEIGSGNSSKLIASALELNHTDGWSAQYRIIDPSPSRLTRTMLPAVTTVIPDRVELLDPSLFDDLAANDILFIDTGHTVRIGGDVNFLVLDVLPRLRSGVIVHIHDVNLPYEYDQEYACGQANTFRRFWTESYLVQAFLACNSDFEVLLAMRYLMTEHMDAFSNAFHHYDRGRHKAFSSSLWIRRVASNAAVRDSLVL